MSAKTSLLNRLSPSGPTPLKLCILSLFIGSLRYFEMQENSVYDEKPDVTISRKVYDESYFNKANHLHLSDTSLEKSNCFRTVCTKLASCSCSRTGVSNFLYRLAPIIQWLPKYNVKKDLVADITGGITVGIMHIPQGNKQV